MCAQDTDRRRFLMVALALAGLGVPQPGLAGPRLGAPEPFSFDALAAQARALAARPHRTPAAPRAGLLDRIDYDAYWRIRFRPEMAVPLPGDMSVQFFHLGRYAREPVAVSVLEGGRARPLAYDTALFDMPADSPARALGTAAGLAGLRVMRPGGAPDWLSFLGASYFRCDGPDAQYGLSARGLAIDTGLARAEEFPRFSAFWVGPGEREGEDVAVYALLESPSVTGAYRFGATREAGPGQRLDVSSRLFFRHGVERLGVAPLTSMFWYAEGKGRADAPDWRPEIHDSDGLAIETGAGERLWRPLRNPRGVSALSFFDRDPRGFGLIQRDRDFANYQDDGVFYDRRPSAWVAPRGGWGPGAVQLVEIPTDDETFDNIVAFWTPERQPAAGDALAFDYTLDWRDRDPFPEGLGRVVATRLGWGGVPGQPRPPGLVKYVIDFEGGLLDGLDDGVEAEIWAGDGGTITLSRAYRIVGARGWRLMFDLDGAAERPVELRAFLRRGSDALTETWTMLADHAPRGDGQRAR